MTDMTEPKCTKCDLHKTCRTVQIEPDGTGDIVFLGEAPGADEDRKGIPFIGESGNLLRESIKALDIDPSRVRFTNAVRCRPPSNRTPTAKEIKTCLEHLVEEFISNPPSHIVALGNTALDALRHADLLHTPGKILNLHGKCIKEDGYIVFPFVHPDYIVRNPHAISMLKDLNNLEKIVNEGPPVQKETQYDFSDSVDDLRTAIAAARKAQLVTYDIETAVLHPYDRTAPSDDRQPLEKVVCFALTWQDQQAFGFVLTPENREEAWKILHEELLEDPLVKKVIQHAKFELTWSMATGRTISNMADTMLLHWHVDEKNGTHGLGKLALNFTDMGFYDAPLENYKKEHKECDPDKEYKDKETGEVRKGSYENIPYEILVPYNCADTDAAHRVYKILLPLLNQRQLWIHDNVQIPAVYPLAEMELRGARIDWDYAGQLDHDLPAKIAKIEEEIRSFSEVRDLEEDLKAAGKDGINFNSTSHISELIFNYIGLRSVYNTKGGKPSTDKNVLDYLAEKHPVPKLLKERRAVATLHSTFVRGAFERKSGEVIHTSYGMAHTETGRYNSRNPNLQNIPRDATIKNMYVPDPGDWMVQIDYSQIELRVMALFSADQNLLNYFREGADVHRMIAAKIHKKAPEDISKEERVKAKRTVFGLCYGQSSKGLAEELGIPEREAEDFLNKFFKEFPAVRRWMQETEKMANQVGRVETMFGRVRRLPDAMIKRKEDPMRARAMRQAINMPIQGTATDILSLKMAELWAYMRQENMRSRMIMTVHDSLVLSVHPEEVNHLLPAAKLILEDFSNLSWVEIPILCDMEIGDRWGDLVGIDKSHIDALETGAPLENILSGILQKKTA